MCTYTYIRRSKPHDRDFRYYYYSTAFAVNPATTSRPRTDGCKSSAGKFEETRFRERETTRARLRMQMRGHRGAQRRDRYQFFSRSGFSVPDVAAVAVADVADNDLVSDDSRVSSGEPGRRRARALYYMALYSRGRTFSLGGGGGRGNSPRERGGTSTRAYANRSGASRLSYTSLDRRSSSG